MPNQPVRLSDDPFFDVNADVCANCGRPRGEHSFHRSGARCLNDRTFKLDPKEVVTTAGWAETQRAASACSESWPGVGADPDRTESGDPR